MNETTIEKEKSRVFLLSPSIVVIVFAACFSFWQVDLWRPTNIYNGESSFNNPDIFQCYSYLPAVLLNHSSFDECPATIFNANPMGPGQKHIPKYNYGMAAMYLPAFITALVQDGLDGPPPYGFSPIYGVCLHWASIIYVLLGLLLLRNVLLAFFSDMVTAITLLLCLFGTTLFYYTFTQSELPQGHLFFLFSAFLFCTQKWHQSPSFLYSALCGVILGLTGLIYVFEMYIVLFFIFWNAGDRPGIKSLVGFWRSNYRHLLLMAGIVITLWIPQLIITLQHTGWLFYDTSPKEKHDFADAKISYILLNYHQGWLTYTPLAIVPLIGIFFIRPPFPVSRWVFLFCVMAMLVVYSSWWDLGHGVYFGARRFCSSIAWLSVPLAIIIGRVLDFSLINLGRLLLRFGLVLFFFSCICLNVMQSFQVINRVIRPNSVTEEIYWGTFRTFKLP